MKNSVFTVEFAEKKDNDEILVLVHKTIRACFSKTYAPSVVEWFCAYHNKEKLIKEMEDGALIGAVMSGDKIIATATYYRRELKRVFVDLKLQKQGLGKMLINKLEECAAERDDNAIMLYATPHNWNYYESMGYEKISAAVEFMDDGKPLAYYKMVKRLQPKMWHIRKAQLRDASQIELGQREAFTSVAQKHDHMDMPPMVDSRDDIKKAIYKATVLVAIQNGRIIGSVCGEEKNSVCYISRLWVLPEYQKMGIGDALMYWVEEEFSHLKKYALFTGSRSDNTIRFYIERGYLIIGKEKCRDYELIHFEKTNAKDYLL